jgi:hypothetical protein
MGGQIITALNEFYTADPDGLETLAALQRAEFARRKSQLRWRPALMRSFFSIRPGGMSRRSFLSQTTSHSCHCRQSHPSSTRWKTSGSSCAATGSPTASSTPTKTFSTIVVAPGTSSSICHGKSSQSEQESGPTGRKHGVDLRERFAIAPEAYEHRSAQGSGRECARMPIVRDFCLNWKVGFWRNCTIQAA